MQDMQEHLRATLDEMTDARARLAQAHDAIARAVAEGRPLVARESLGEICAELNTLRVCATILGGAVRHWIADPAAPVAQAAP